MKIVIALLVATALFYLKATVTCPTNGIVVMKNPASCTSYYFCYKGQPHLEECEEGMHFSEKSASCAEPEIAQCTVTVTPKSGALPLQCQQSTEIFFVKHPTSCDHYYSCVKGTMSLEQCEEGLRFDESSQECVSAVPQCHPVNTEFHRDYFDCSKYYTCVKGVAFLLTCPDGFVFDSIRLLCNLPEEVEDCSC